MRLGTPTLAPTAYCPYGEGTFTTPTGSISIPSKYASSVTCNFVIKTGATIYVRFDSLSTESGYDYLEIYDGSGDDGNKLGKFSGNDITLPEVQTATSGSMFIRFSSDSSKSGNGVSMTWSDAVLTSAPFERCALTKEMVESYPPCSECASQAQARPLTLFARSSSLREPSCQQGGVRVAGAGK